PPNNINPENLLRFKLRCLFLKLTDEWIFLPQSYDLIEGIQFFIQFRMETRDIKEYQYWISSFDNNMKQLLQLKIVSSELYDEILDLWKKWKKMLGFQDEEDLIRSPFVSISRDIE